VKPLPEHTAGHVPDGVVDNDIVPAGQDLGEARPGVAVLKPAVADELDHVVGNAVGNGRPLVAIWVSKNTIHN
jgi:hypothetical protein